jgi:MFS transporter, OPA family, sugar phosphate sensor protein UhpC
MPDPATRGAAYSLASTSQNAGAGFASLTLPQAVEWADDWRAACVEPLVVGLLVAAVCFFLLSDRPDKDSSAVTPSAAGGGSGSGGGGMVAVRAVLSDYRQWLLGGAYVVLSVVRSGTADWAVKLLTDKSNGGLTLVEAGTSLSLLEVGGIIGALAGGAVSDFVSRGRRAPVMLGCALLSIPFCFPGSILRLPGLSPSVWALALYFGLGLFTFTPHMLIGLMAREIAPPGAINTAGGFVKGLGQFGSSLAGTPLALTLQAFGWHGVSLVWAGCMLLAALCFFLLEVLEPRKDTEPKKDKVE